MADLKSIPTITIDHAFADEWQLPDLILQPSEVSAVRYAAHKLGMELTRTPTGRTNQMVLRAALDYAIYMRTRCQRGTRAAREWDSAIIRAKFALGQKSFN